jgi:hypothetical protein
MSQHSGLGQKVEKIMMTFKLLSVIMTFGYVRNLKLALTKVETYFCCIEVAVCL